MRVLRYLAALAPLLGLALAGCGGLLGAVDGTGVGPTPGPRLVTVSGRAIVEEQIFGRQAGDRSLAGATVRVLRFTATGAAVEVPGATVTAGAGGSFSVSFVVDEANRGDLHAIEVFGSVTGITGSLLLRAPFIPGQATTIQLDVSVASTIVAASLVAALQGGQGLTFTQDDIQRTITRVQGIVRNPATADATVRVADLPTGATVDEARTRLTLLATRVAAVYNALVDRVEVRAQGTTGPAGAFIATSGDPVEQLAVSQGQTVTLVGRALASDNTVLAAGIDFAIESGSGITLTQTGANLATVRGNTLNAVATVVARIAVPGTTQAERKLVRFTVRVVQHNQGHIQGGGTGG